MVTYWLVGRRDDVINVSGHRLGTTEFESALVSHKAVAEAIKDKLGPTKGTLFTCHCTNIGMFVK